MIFQDGQLPSQDVIDRWLAIVDRVFEAPDGPPQAAAAAAPAEPPLLEEEKTQKIGQLAKAGSTKRTKSLHSTTAKQQPDKRIAVHCVAGLGRAPFLVALAIVYKGCKPQNAIRLIRLNRKGALNPIQANYILEMKPGTKGAARSNGSQGCQCNIF